MAGKLARRGEKGREWAENVLIPGLRRRLQQGGCGGRIASVEALGEVAGACGMKVREEVVDSVLEIAGGDRVANVRLAAATACGVVAKGLDDGNVKDKGIDVLWKMTKEDEDREVREAAQKTLDDLIEKR